MSESTLTFPEADASKLEPHLPPKPSSTTAASSPDTQDAGPSPQLPFSKAMTHYLRSRHAAICVGVGTALADDPGLNCRIAPSSDANGQQQPPRQPRPIIIDPHQRWAFTSESKVLQLARAGRGLAPTSSSPRRVRTRPRNADGCSRSWGQNSSSSSSSPSSFAMDWRDILCAVRAEGLDSIMVEGGGQVISSLLGAPNAQLVDSVIITIAPTWLGAGSVFVSPPGGWTGRGTPCRRGDS
ncbi:riboflavin biosynthesis protein Rib7 [Apiospora hydei]|uniref:2,5-diamino-6-ribosylamino-4(3H)-pyrimidinone 5'-phosphate reductase n=1 Tax=Apiospora hydei TaxID=1337664 RepID=A0ABR1WAK6_9PEZI